MPLFCAAFEALWIAHFTFAPIQELAVVKIFVFYYDYNLSVTRLATKYTEEEKKWQKTSPFSFVLFMFVAMQGYWHKVTVKGRVWQHCKNLKIICLRKVDLWSGPA
jgi:hypothetical protein